jgi:hypothetical protein
MSIDKQSTIGTINLKQLRRHSLELCGIISAMRSLTLGTISAFFIRRRFPIQSGAATKCVQSSSVAFGYDFAG